jgi:hypothetical protein
MARHIKIIEDIPKEDLDAMIAVHKNDGAQVGYKEQPNGKFRLEAVFEDAEPAQTDTFRSLVSGDQLKPG